MCASLTEKGGAARAEGVCLRRAPETHSYVCPPGSCLRPVPLGPHRWGQSWTPQSSVSFGGDRVTRGHSGLTTPHLRAPCLPSCVVTSCVSVPPLFWEFPRRDVWLPVTLAFGSRAQEHSRPCVNVQGINEQTQGLCRGVSTSLLPQGSPDDFSTPCRQG